MRIAHLYHSGVLIETNDIQIFIDVISDISTWVNHKKKLYFFVTHSHQDHYDPSIAKYIDSSAIYVMSDDILDFGHPEVFHVMPNRQYVVGSLDVKTFGSTDQGVSFLIGVEGKKIFHAGDLNWWHWVNDSQDKQLEEETAFKGIVQALPGEHIDVAFIPCDLRLGDAKTWAIDYFASAKSVSYVVPIHFRTHFEVSAELIKHFHGSGKAVRVTKCDEVVLNL